MNVSKTEKKKVMSCHSTNEKYRVNKIYYITVLYYCGSNHWKCSRLNFLT